MRRRLALLLAAGILLVPGWALAQTVGLRGEVGPGFSISLTRDGSLVRQLDPGTYEFTVRDLSEEHNFHLYGPGVDRFTTVEGTGTVTWTVTLREGRYQYLCDPHPYDMAGAFVVGNPPPPPGGGGGTTPPKPAPTPLNAAVGPRNTITLRNKAGRIVKTLKPGAYRITVRDRTKLHNFHLVGLGVNRKTTVVGMGTFTWNVTLKKGTVRYYSDKAPLKLRGIVKVG